MFREVNFVRKRDVHNFKRVVRHNPRKLLVARRENLNPVGDFKIAFAAHDLHLADNFANKAFLNQRGRQRRRQGNRNVAVALAVEAFALRDGNLNVFSRQRDVAELKFAGLVEFELGGLPVEFFERGFDFAHALADLLAEDAEIRLDVVADRR